MSFPRVKIKYLANEKLTYGANESAELEDIELPRYIRITDLDSMGKLKEHTFKSLTWEKATPYLLEQGDLLFARSGATVGKSYIHDSNFPACFAGYLIKLKVKKNKVLPLFVFYFSQTNYYQSWIAENTIQATIQNVSAEKYANLKIPLPPINIQNQIVTFINFKLKDIDDLLNSKEILVKKLEQQRQSIITEAVTKGLNPNVKMKDSGVEWIGEIPENWSVKKVKYLISEPLSYGANESAELDDRELPRYIRITDIDDSGKLRESTFKSISKEIANLYNVKNGDILLARSGATVGKSYFHRESEAASHAGYLIKLRAKNYKIGEYIYLYTQSTIYFQWINSNLIQATIQNVSAEKYANLYVSIPDRIEEVELIVNNIKHRSDEINSLIQKIKIEINLIKEYRQSLIYEAVTGKIDVSEMELEEVR